MTNRKFKTRQKTDLGKNEKGWSSFDLSLLSPNQNFVITLKPKASGPASAQDVLSWAKGNRSEVDRYFIEFGGILLKGFNYSSDDFKTLVKELFPGRIGKSYKGGGALRKKVDDDLYLASAADKRVTLPLHQELTYSYSQAPDYIFFYCDTPPESGGETPVFSSRTFMKTIDKAIVDKIDALNVIYRWNLEKGSDVYRGWADMFETTNKSEVEKFLKENSVGFEWKKNDVLVNMRPMPGIAAHPITGERLLFNQIYFQTRSSGVKGRLAPHWERHWGPAHSAEYMNKMRNMPAEDLQTNVYFGDGSYIDAAVLEEMDAIHLKEQVAFKWEKGDVLLLDNYLAWHGRNPFGGDQRKILTMWARK